MTTKLTLITILAVLLFVLVVWYTSSLLTNWLFGGSNKQQEVSNAPDTTEKISKEFMQLPNDSTINQEMNSFDQDVQSF